MAQWWRSPRCWPHRAAGTQASPRSRRWCPARVRGAAAQGRCSGCAASSPTPAAPVAPTADPRPRHPRPRDAKDRAAGAPPAGTTCCVRPGLRQDRAAASHDSYRPAPERWNPGAPPAASAPLAPGLGRCALAAPRRAIGLLGGGPEPRPGLPTMASCCSSWPGSARRSVRQPLRRRDLDRPRATTSRCRPRSWSRPRPAACGFLGHRWPPPVPRRRSAARRLAQRPAVIASTAGSGCARPRSSARRGKADAQLKERVLAASASLRTAKSAGGYTPTGGCATARLDAVAITTDVAQTAGTCCAYRLSAARAGLCAPPAPSPSRHRARCSADILTARFRGRAGVG